MTDTPKTAAEIAAELRAGLEGVTLGPWGTKTFKPCGIGMSTMSDKAVQGLAHAVTIGRMDVTITHTEQKIADVSWEKIPYNECGETGLVRSKALKEYELDETVHPDAAHIARCSPENIKTLLDERVKDKAEIERLEKEIKGWVARAKICADCE